MVSTLDNFAIVKNLGLKDYLTVFRDMQQFNADRTPDTPDEIWLLQHHPVFTLGTNAKPEHLLNPENIPVVQTDRGGQVTYHAPGQLIAYVLIDVRRKGMGVRELVTALEESVIQFLSMLGVKAEADPKAPGVYVNGAKIAALGLRVKQKGSYHGLSLNVDMNLEDFDRINPCGYPGMKVTSLKELGIPLDMSQTTSRMLESLCQQLDITEFEQQ